MNEKDAIRRLCEQCGFEAKTATAYVRARGYCEYCERDLVAKRFPYACAEIDHLLPKSKAKQLGYDASAQENHVLACHLCNNVKGNHVVLVKGEDPKQMLKSSRGTLIKRACKYIGQHERKNVQLHRKVRKIFFDLDE